MLLVEGVFVFSHRRSFRDDGFSCFQVPEKPNHSGDYDLQVMDESEDKPLKGLELEQNRNLQWMIEEGWKDLEVKMLPAQLQECIPELHPNDGPHAIFEQPFERDRAESSCICHLEGWCFF